MEELAKVLCEKLGSHRPEKQWLAVKLVDRLYTADECIFQGRKQMVVSEIEKVYYKHNNSSSAMCKAGFKCKIEATTVLQKITGEVPQSNRFGQNAIQQQFIPSQNDLAHLPAGVGGFLQSPRLDSSHLHFGVPVSGAGRTNTNIRGSEYNAHAHVSTAQSVAYAAAVDPLALERTVLQEVQKANQLSDILQELLCNFSTSDTTQSEEDDTLEMLGDLSEQSKALVERMNSLVLKCQEHIESAGISEAVGQSTLAMDKLRDSLDLYDDVQHTITIQRQSRGNLRRNLGSDTQESNESPQSSHGPPVMSPTPPTSVKYDTNPFRRLTQTEGHDSHSSQSQKAAANVSNVEAGQSSLNALQETFQSTPAAHVQETKSKEMLQLESLFDTSTDLLAGGQGGNGSNYDSSSHAGETPSGTITTQTTQAQQEDPFNLFK